MAQMEKIPPEAAENSVDFTAKLSEKGLV